MGCRRSGGHGGLLGMPVLRAVWHHGGSPRGARRRIHKPIVAQRYKLMPSLYRRHRVEAKKKVVKLL